MPLSLSPTKGVGSSRIVGGTDALPNEFPHQILFLKKRPHCGGTLFNEKYIISAAHCFEGQVQSDLKVVGGDHNFTLDECTEQVSNIKRIIKHENYGGEGNSNSNDIALVEVDPPFRLNAQIQPALMPQLNFVAKGDGIVTGWCTLDATYGGKPDILQKVTVPIVSNAECVDAYEPTYFEILPTMLCAGFLGKGGKDACHGDSGGSLVIKLDNGSYILVGVVSFGKGCADPHFPGVYTDVSKFVDWIHKNAI